MVALRRDDKSWCFDTDELKQMVIGHFQSVYTAETSVGHALNLCPIANFYFNADQLSILVSIPQDDEKLLALTSIQPFKTPGPDGFQAGFYQQHWEKVRFSVCSFVRNAFLTGSFDENHGKVLISLIPKVEYPKFANQ